MAVVISEDTAYAKEVQKWEGHKYLGNLPPGRPYQYFEYPTRLYKAGRVEGRAQIVEGRTAHDEHERSVLEGQGFVCGGQQAALDALAAQEQWEAKLAAERAYEVAHGRLSEKAAAEVAAHEAAAGARHLPTIPETPIKPRRKPGPKPRVAQPA